MESAERDPLVTFEVAAHRDVDARANRAWRLADDGAFRMHRNGDDAMRPPDGPLFWYDGPFPEAPSRVLDAERLQRVRDFLETLRDLPPRTERLCPEMEGGSRLRATFRTPGGLRVVEVDSPERDFLDGLMMPLLKALEVP